MSKFVVLRLEGEAAFWLVDFNKGSVTPVEADGSLVDAADGLAAEQAGGPGSIRGVEVAVLAHARGDVASQKLYAGA
jgi:hypothetical protein